MHIAHGLSPFRGDDTIAVFHEQDDDDLDSSSAGGSAAWRLPDFADEYYADQGIAAHTPTSLPATRHAPSAHAPMLDMGSLAFGEPVLASKHPAPPPRYVCPTPPLSELGPRVHNRTPTPTAKQRTCRNFWSVDGDRALLRAMLHHEHLLAVARKSRPRSRYWQTISEALATQFGMHRNKRQCRDRFNLIYWKAVRDSHQDLSTDSELAGLMRECMRRFYIDKDNNLMLRPQAPSPVTPAAPTAPAASATPAAPAAPASPVHKPQLELLAHLQNQVFQLTHRLDDLHRALDAHRTLVRQLEQSPDAWPHTDDPAAGLAAHGYQDRCAGRIFGLNDQIW
ncbi:LAQU0S07e03906g1_1 [Lachancea quebecensis]|uniref:LAQU0S07e03906g1_1 n=1 Tax=Lachancea quebecensis TaxID=1654605 RepID=A0A0P1KT02_9SACH|nr:LAQU0S07e03906g1_1 [Lachancea quebecensis]